MEDKKKKKTINKDQVDNMVDRLFSNNYKHRNPLVRENEEKKNKTIDLEDEPDINDSNTINKSFSKNKIKNNEKEKKNNKKFNSKIIINIEDLDLIARGLVKDELDNLKNLRVGYTQKPQVYRKRIWDRESFIY